jgi:hypothetical protein
VIAPSADRGADRGETRDTGTDHQHLGGRHLAGGGHLAGEEAAEIVARLDHRAVAGDVGHRRQRVHLLRAADPRHHLHRDDVGALGLGELEPSSLPAGLKKVISVLSWRSECLSSASVGIRTLAMMSASFHSAAAVLTTVTPAAS